MAAFLGLYLCAQGSCLTRLQACSEHVHRWQGRAHLYLAVSTHILDVLSRI